MIRIVSMYTSVDVLMLSVFQLGHAFLLGDKYSLPLDVKIKDHNNEFRLVNTLQLVSILASWRLGECGADQHS